MTLITKEGSLCFGFNFVSMSEHRHRLRRALNARLAVAAAASARDVRASVTADSHPCLAFTQD